MQNRVCRGCLEFWSDSFGRQVVAADGTPLRSALAHVFTSEGQSAKPSTDSRHGTEQEEGRPLLPWLSGESKLLARVSSERRASHLRSRRPRSDFHR